VIRHAQRVGLLLAGAWLVLAGWACSRKGPPLPGLARTSRRTGGQGGEVMLRLSRPDTRAAAAREIGEQKLRAAVPALQGYIQDKDPEVRLNCVWALGEMQAREAIMDVRTLLTDKADRVRVAAAEALGKMPDSSAVLWLGQALKDQFADVRVAAARALGNVPETKAAEWLVKALDDRSELVVDAAGAGLGRIGRPAIGPVREGLAKLTPEARLLVARALAGVKDPAATEALVEVLALSVPGPKHRSDAKIDAVTCQVTAEALVAAGEPAIEPLARKAVHVHGNLPLKQQAARVLARLGKPAAAPIVNRLTPWKVFPDRRELDLWVETLQQIGDPNALKAVEEVRKRSGSLEGGARRQGLSVAPVD